MSDEAATVGWVLALSRLPGMGPARLCALLDGLGAARAWQQVRAGRVERSAVTVYGGLPRTLLDDWRRAAAAIDPVELVAEHARRGVQVVVRGAAAYPAALRHDPDPPALLCCRGDLRALDPPRVAIVGTRRASRYGLDVARRLGAELAEAGVAVVSGLALGIDGAAHGGVRSVEGAAPVAVVGSGVDVVYPARNRGLWNEVAEHGLLCSEAPLGTRPEPWRFPARNRIIAGLADAVVVVESPERGGAMLTVDEALLRDRPVFAVPGPISSPASAGTNRLLAEGATPLLDVADVLDRLVGHQAPSRGAHAERHAVPLPEGPAREVLDALGWEPVGLDELASRVSVAPEGLALLVSELEVTGWVARRGAWLERVTR